ncbi:chaperone DnaJ, variant 2 [Cryptococcus amylolentus CBS 6039]|uniref:DnaJ homolog 1, mitochondrial n=2 Tax=Cryptococcus amylolentus TaxID=104669 RepID=A0A1E3I9N5_9TREE|nr:chaperone DnaJ [Cryptococcus amylolentus CBS 6039]XP_018998295.1 chaperone DnaJ, variant 1 [Cryptococcus amylolentus CBS 6039]XP_018998296.1 chaperone DnaJ, variant 2 [Cryptococcus amylolentus CBS 6039]ODO11716.1 chaperone DnaJ [Cryptococcus amylolentus CBS 6273]ODN84491.1 chaperone DnaJ [Cryptococcus amylolentus CBS 6039]ODN84492.1 chaperone DnaJ, variant 1 [Cryptococcus amylolentus CBS 6039]ODN84493.1 chaperone DnaJ, variant 2 [Cryptococcus amylolentus CBS 6039]
MPPRIPTRAFTALPISQPVASSSAIPPQPRCTSPRSSPSHHFSTLHAAARPLPANATEKRRSFHSTAVHSASAKDPYDVLGVKKEASSSDIKKAYYSLAKKWHPDSSKEPNAKDRFHEIQSAYDVLSDDKKRKAYDTYGSASQQEGFDPNFPGGAGGFGGFQGFGGGFGGGGNASDLFESLFGGQFGGGRGGFGGGARQRPVRGDDLEAGVNLEFLEACKGTTRKVTITPVVDCKPCTGSGLKPGEKKTQCSTCRGTGQQTFQVQGMIMASTCQACGGAGSSIPPKAKCGSCDGVGKVKDRKVVDVEIPAGVEDGMMIRIPGAGDMPLGASGPPGDLLVRVLVRPSTKFRRQGTNVHHDAKVPLHTALLGGVIRIPTLEGEVDVKVKGGTQNGEEAVLKGRGVQSVYSRGKSERGDLIVQWKIQIPRTLTPFQRKILQAYADDLEGRTPQIHFGPSPSESASTPNGETSSRNTSRPPSSWSTHPDAPRRTVYEKPHSPSHPSSPSSSSQQESSRPYEPVDSDDSGLAGKVASAVGGVIGWVERLLGKR